MTAGEVKFSEAISCRPVFWRSHLSVDQVEEFGVAIGGPTHGEPFGEAR